MARVPLDSEEAESCNGTLQAVRSCNLQGCAKSCMPVDCVWGDWEEWSKCGETCGGVRTRNRRVDMINSCGGLACLPNDAQTYESCPNCEEDYCVWNDWSDVGQCSAKCGQGRLLRERKLEQTTRPPLDQPDLVMKAEQEALQQRVAAIEQRRVRGVVGSFAGGLLSCVALLAVVYRRVRSTAAPRRAHLLSWAGDSLEEDELSPMSASGATANALQRRPLL